MGNIRVQRLGIGAAFAASALLGTAVQAGPANADVGVRAWDQCQPGLFCVFEHVDGGADLLRGTAANWTDIGAEGKGDKVTSVWNRSPWTGRLYDWSTRGCWIHLGTYGPGFKGNLVPAANDRTDAIGLDGNVGGRVC